MGAAHLRGPHATVADAVMAAVRGGEAAKRALHRIKHGNASPDELMEALKEQQATGEAERSRAFMRELQKALERAT